MVRCLAYLLSHVKTLWVALEIFKMWAYPYINIIYIYYQPFSNPQILSECHICVRHYGSYWDKLMSIKTCSHLCAFPCAEKFSIFLTIFVLLELQGQPQGSYPMKLSFTTTS